MITLAVFIWIQVTLQSNDQGPANLREDIIRNLPLIAVCALLIMVLVGFAVMVFRRRKKIGSQD